MFRPFHSVFQAETEVRAPGRYCRRWCCRSPSCSAYVLHLTVRQTLTMPRTRRHRCRTPPRARCHRGRTRPLPSGQHPCPGRCGTRAAGLSRLWAQSGHGGRPPGQMRLQQTNLRLSPRPGWAGWLRRSRRHRTPRPSPRPPQTYRPTRRRPLLSRPRQYNTRISKTARTRRPARRRRRPIGRTGRPARRRHSPAGRRQRSAPRSQDRRGRRHLRRSHHCRGDGAVGPTASVLL